MPFKNHEARLVYSRKWAADRRAAFFLDKECAWCGSRENLELDHIDPGPCPQNDVKQNWSNAGCFATNAIG